MLLYVNIAVAILLTIYLCRSKCKENKNEFSILFEKYDPERRYFMRRELKDNLLNKTITFLHNKNTYMSHRMFKTIEFYVAETIIGLTIAITNTEDSYHRVKYIVKIANLIEDYTNIYYKNDEIIDSLIYRVYQNMLKIETDIYHIYKVMNEVLKTTTRKQLNKSLITVYKNFYWYPTLRFKHNTFVQFVKSNINK